MQQSLERPVSSLLVIIFTHGATDGCASPPKPWNSPTDERTGSQMRCNMTGNEKPHALTGSQRMVALAIARKCACNSDGLHLMWAQCALNSRLASTR